MTKCPGSLSGFYCGMLKFWGFSYCCGGSLDAQTSVIHSLDLTTEGRAEAPVGALLAQHHHRDNTYKIQMTRFITQRWFLSPFHPVMAGF